MNDFWYNKQAIVTGGGGFLGSHVVAQLQQRGCPQIFVPRSAQYDLTSADNVRQMFDDAEQERGALQTFIVLHIAGLSGGISANKTRPADFYYQNVMMNTLVFDLATRYGAEKLIAAGAGIGYPMSAPSPLHESMLWDGFPQIESASYALSKRMLQVQSNAYWQQHRLPSSVLILGSLYGPGDRFDPTVAPVIPSLISKFVDAAANGHQDVVAWGTGKATRDFLFVTDAASAFLKAAEICQDAQIYNIASGYDTSIRAVVEIIVELSRFRGKVLWDTSKPDGASARRFDVNKALTELEWSAKVSLRDGLKETIEWYQAYQHNKKCLK